MTVKSYGKCWLSASPAELFSPLCKSLPYWLLKYPQLQLRCCDELYFEKIRRYFSVLLPRLKSLLYKNGGPIIAMQVENEYGSFGSDKEYIPRIKRCMESFGMDTFYLTSDGTEHYMLTGGTAGGVYASANFGSHPAKNFKAMDEIRPGQPHMCMEYWCGWFQHWGKRNLPRDPADMLAPVSEMLAAGDSFNIYMFCGGTNFGFYNGANFSDKYLPTVTSYDYGGLLTENGEITEQYRLIQAEIAKYSPLPPQLSVPENQPFSYGKVKLTQSAGLFEQLERISAPVQSPMPQRFEQLGVDYGFVLYRTAVRCPKEDMRLVLEGLHDRALVYTDGQLRGVKGREGMQDDEIWIGAREKDVSLDILVENMGRINYGPHMRDEKGITGVIVGQQYQHGCTMYPLSLKNLSAISFTDGFVQDGRPRFYRAVLNAAECADTFIDMTGFTKGVVFVNGFNLGRYWEQGPYHDLYLPGSLLKKGENEIIIFELENAQRDFLTLNNTRTVE